MAYLSRIWLNPRRLAAQRFITNPQAVHAAILAGLSAQPITERVLWRLDPDPRTEHRLELLVLTRSRPSWESVIEQAGWPESDEPQSQVRPYQPLLERVAIGREFAFRVKANPASSTRRPDSPRLRDRLASQKASRGVRVGHRTAAHQLNWFTSRTERWGFEIVTDGAGLPALRLVSRGRHSFQKGTGKDNVVLETATFDGILRVTDAERLRTTLLSGIGPGKAYGLGLLTLAPPVRESGDS